MNDFITIMYNPSDVCSNGPKHCKNNFIIVMASFSRLCQDILKKYTFCAAEAKFGLVELMLSLWEGGGVLSLFSS